MSQTREAVAYQELVTHLLKAEREENATGALTVRGPTMRVLRLT